MKPAMIFNILSKVGYGTTKIYF